MRLLVAFIVVAVIPLFSQSPSLEQQAQEHINKQEWKQAIQAYRQLVKQDSPKGVWWYNLGYALHSSKQYGEAITAYEHAPYVYTAPFGAYNVACAFARLRQNDSAFAWLDRAVTLGYVQSKAMEKDEDLASLHSDKRFGELVHAMEIAATPCMYDQRYRVFDYWVGEWNVYAPGGRHAGISSIQRILDGAVIFENWTSLGANYQGKSFNYLDTTIGKWKQLWIDNRAGITDYTGGMDNGTMTFFSSGINTKGQPYTLRLRFFNISPDSVRQFSEQTLDDGKTWSTQYDLMYVRKKE